MTTLRKLVRNNIIVKPNKTSLKLLKLCKQKNFTAQYPKHAITYMAGMYNPIKLSGELIGRNYWVGLRAFPVDGKLKQLSATDTNCPWTVFMIRHGKSVQFFQTREKAVKLAEILNKQLPNASYDDALDFYIAEKRKMLK